MGPAEPTPAAPPALSDGPVDLEDFACHRCGYPLRGLDAQGRCPECGLEISISLSADNLRFSDPLWLHTLGLGIFGLLIGLGAMAFSDAWATVISVVRSERVPFLQQLGSAGSVIYMFAMTALITAPEPGRRPFETTFSLRRISRILAGIVLGIDVLPLYWLLFSQLHLRGEATLECYNAITILSAALALVCGLLYLRVIALRRADAFLLRHLPLVGSGIGGIMTVSLIFTYAPLHQWRQYEQMITALQFLLLALFCYAGYVLIEFRRRLASTLAAALRLPRHP